LVLSTTAVGPLRAARCEASTITLKLLGSGSVFGNDAGKCWHFPFDRNHPHRNRRMPCEMGTNTYSRQRPGERRCGSNLTRRGETTCPMADCGRITAVPAQGGR
jgi:hypothetical protein